jgi:hypothetical protein
MEVLFLVKEFSWNLQNNYVINFKGKPLIITRISSQKHFSMLDNKVSPHTDISFINKKLYIPL